MGCCNMPMFFFVPCVPFCFYCALDTLTPFGWLSYWNSRGCGRPDHRLPCQMSILCHTASFPCSIAVWGTECCLGCSCLLFFQAGAALSSRILRLWAVWSVTLRSLAAVSSARSVSMLLIVLAALVNIPIVLRFGWGWYHLVFQ